jgi:hypothetical protein
MQSSPHRFNQYRRQNNPKGGVINTTVSEIMRYVIDCYLFMLDEKPQYSISKTKKETTYKFEDYLTSRFVEDYLSKRLSAFRPTHLNEIQFTTETTRKYFDTIDRKEKPDKIDIYITNLQLEKELSSNPQPYIAIECKRIRNSNSFDDYIADIKKFTDRNHVQTRLPYEGQLAFIENSKYPHSVSFERINSKLMKHESIKTTQLLEYNQFHERFDGSYCSRHLKNFGEKNSFAIYHLMFDYTNIVID